MDILTSIFGGGGRRTTGPPPGGYHGIADLLRNPGHQVGGPLAKGGDIFARLNSVFGQFGGAGVTDAQTGLRSIMGDTGQGLLDAYQPTYQKNLGLAREQGPRFSTGNAMLGAQALNDYNLFAAQTGENARNRALQAAMGLGNLSLGQGQGQGNILQQLLQALFKGGGISDSPIYNISPGIGQQLLGAATTIGGAALGGGFGGGAGGGAVQGGRGVA